MYKMRWKITKNKITPEKVKSYRENHGCGMQEAKVKVENLKKVLEYLDPETNTWIEVPIVTFEND